MMRSLFSGVSGLRNHQVRMDVIGNNVSNVNTVAFNAGRVTFKEGFAQLLQGASRPPGDQGGINPIQIGLGVQIGSIDTLFSQGNFETTGAPSGYYGFTQDASGNIQLYKNGIAVGSPQLGADGATLDFGDVSITLGSNWSTSPGFPTSYSSANDVTVMSTPTITDSVNKDAFTETSVTTFDGLGDKHELKVQLWKTGANTWGWRVDPSNLGATLSGTTSGVLNFDPNTGMLAAGASNPVITYTPAGSGAAPVSVTLDLGIGAVNGISQFAGTTTAVLRDQDGYTAGTLQSFSIDRTGTITGSFTNGTTEPLAQIVLADFNNPGGLLRVGDNMYSVSGNSGGAVLGYALEGSQSSITSGALEMSNVDLAEEFTNMIVAQRGFQANGRMITTSDEMLQELVNLKR